MSTGPGTPPSRPSSCRSFLQEQPAYAGGIVTYRSANSRVAFPDPFTGIAIPFDSGTIGFLLQRSDGGFGAGTAHGETLYITSPGTPGLWRLRIFAAALGPADAGSQATVRDILDHVVSTLELSAEFFQLWNQAHDHTVQQMRQYSATMDRVFSRYLESAGRSTSRNGDDPLEGWAAMMRGGEYAEDETTGEQYWVGNDRDYWWVNDQGTVVGNDTGAVPTNSGNWRGLLRRR